MGQTAENMCLTRRVSYPTQNSVTCEKQCCQDKENCVQYDPRDPSTFNVCSKTNQCAEPTADQVRREKYDLFASLLIEEHETSVQLYSANFPLCKQLIEDFFTIMNTVVYVSDLQAY